VEEHKVKEEKEMDMWLKILLSILLFPIGLIAWAF